MAKIKIKDLPMDTKISRTEMKKVFGGGTEEDTHRARMNAMRKRRSSVRSVLGGLSGSSSDSSDSSDSSSSCGPRKTDPNVMLAS